MSAVLAVDDAKVWFGGVRAVDGVSMTLEAGKLYGLVGPNGSGKTTLINAISGVTKLTAGSIAFDGADTAGRKPFQLSRAGMARTFQAIRLVPDLDVRENVLLGADRHAGGAAKVDELLERLHLSHLAKSAPQGLSYGTQRRVEIARALASEPKLLLLDEPVAGMNRSERDEIARLIRSLRDEGLTQLLIEHDLRLILESCDHMVVMNFGRSVAEGEPRATAELPVVREAYLGMTDGAA